MSRNKAAVKSRSLGNGHLEYRSIYLFLQPAPLNCDVAFGRKISWKVVEGYTNGGRSEDVTSPTN